MDKTCALVLAAGDGKRMKSRHPKVLCEVLFKPMLSWVIDSCRLAEIEELCVVVAPDADEVRAVLPEGCRTAEQAEKLGTGHAVMMAADFLEEHRDCSVLVLCGDAPFVDEETIRGALREHRENGHDLTVVAAGWRTPPATDGLSGTRMADCGPLWSSGTPMKRPADPGGQLGNLLV